LTAEINDVTKREHSIRIDKDFIIIPKAKAQLIDKEVSLTSNMKQWFLFSAG